MAYDVFISYSHRDNFTLDEEDRWVRSFHTALYHWLGDFLKREPNIFYDEAEMRGNAKLTQTIETALDESTIFLPIVSSYYLKSEWCRRELEYFKNRHKTEDEVKSRMFPIVKTPLDDNEKKNLSTLFEDNLYSDFFTVDSASKKLLVFDPILGGKHKDGFFGTTNDLARQIAEYINIKPTPTPDKPTPDEKLPLIYLAEPSSDLAEKYNEIKRDLEQRKDRERLKFDFLIPQPKKPTDDEKTFQQKVKEDIAKCRLVVNLIGRDPNSYPKGSTKSHIQIQTEIAATRDGNTDFNRLVWIPRDVASEDGDFQSFIDGIRATGVDGDGLMQDSFEKFKTRIIEILDNKPKSDLPAVPGKDSWFYVLCDKSDIESVSKVEQLLQDKNYAIFSAADYLKAAINGDSDANIYENHNEYLKRCNAVVIFWDKARIPWIRKNVFDLQGSRAIREGRDIDFQAVILDGDLDDDKVRFRTPPPKNCFKINYTDFSNILSQAI